MTFVRLIARPLLAAPFVVEGVGALARPKDHVEAVQQVRPMLEDLGVPPSLLDDPTPIIRASGAVAALSGLMLATGRSQSAAALTLAAVALPTTLAKHPVWEAGDRAERTRHLTGVLKGAGLTGGLLLAAADRKGRPSWAWRVQNAREHRADIRRAKAKVKNRHAK
ncbi:DoxX family membrane protein [Georgenia deserti]|uniref:DoxX family membrane protein n=1 Tax=Georgenia deserti TaxID=2093781 RepID=A0ABW4L497_9MICO